MRGLSCQLLLMDETRDATRLLSIPQNAFVASGEVDSTKKKKKRVLGVVVVVVYLWKERNKNG